MRRWEARLCYSSGQDLDQLIREELASRAPSCRHPIFGSTSVAEIHRTAGASPFWQVAPCGASDSDTPPLDVVRARTPAHGRGLECARLLRPTTGLCWCFQFCRAAASLGGIGGGCSGQFETLEGRPLPFAISPNISRRRLEDRGKRLTVKLYERFHEVLHIDGPALMEGNETRATRAASRMPRVRAPASCHRRDDDSSKMAVQWRDDHAARVSCDCTSERGIESREASSRGRTGNASGPIPLINEDVQKSVRAGLMHNDLPKQITAISNDQRSCWYERLRSAVRKTSNCPTARASSSPFRLLAQPISGAVLASCPASSRLRRLGRHSSSEGAPSVAGIRRGYRKVRGSRSRTRRRARPARRRPAARSRVAAW